MIGNSSEDLIVKTIDLTVQEKAKLFKIMIGIWITGILMGVFLIWMMFYFSENHDKDGVLNIVKLVFASLFIGVLIYIIYTHTKNAYQTQKTVYTGIVKEKKSTTQKRSNVSKNNSFMDTKYEVLIADTWFTFDAPYFVKVLVGDKVDISCVNGKNIIDVTIIEKVELESERAPIFSGKTKNQMLFEDVADLSIQDKARIRKQFWVALFKRFLGGAALAVLLYFVIFLIVLFLLRNIDTAYFNYIYYAIVAVCIITFLWMNKRTLNLFKDLYSLQKYVVKDTLIDKVMSNVKKPSPNSTYTSSNHDYHKKFCYFRTQFAWLEVKQEEFDTVEIGAQIEIDYSMFTKVILNTRVVNN